MIGQTISRYRILSKLGEGGMGVVYTAEDALLGRCVAIKTLHVEAGKPHHHQRFLREARAVSALNHPNIAVVYDYGETSDGKPFIVMELVQGQTLETLLSQKNLSLSRILEIIEHVTDALEEAHRCGIIHRDIKPSNIIISERGEIKVLDFGLAKSLETVPPSLTYNSEALALLPTQTLEGMIIGTPNYLSPEQAMGAPLDGRSDIFSLGSLLYECLTGVPAFPGSNAIAICAKIIRDDPLPPSSINSQVPPELDKVTFKLLAKKPENRYQSAHDFLNELKEVRTALLNGKGMSARKAEPRWKAYNKAWELLAESSRKRRNLVAASLLAIVLVLTTVGIWRSRSAAVYKPQPEIEQWYSRGMNALRDGTYYQASKMLEQAVTLDQRYALAHARLAESLAELGYTERATSEISRANILVISDGLKLPKTDTLYLRAVNATIARDFGAAIDNYREILMEVPEGEKAFVYVDLGRASEKNEDFEQALKSYEEAMQINPQCAAAFLRAGILYGRQQDVPRAEATLDKAYTLYEAQTNIEGLTEVLYQRGLLSISRGQIEEARKTFEKALNTAQTIKSSYQQARTLLQLSRVSSTASEPERAKQLAVEAIEIAQSNNLHNLAAEGLNDLGSVYFAQNEIGQAVAYYNQALNLAQAQKLRGGEARALLSLGSLYVQQDDADRGLQYIRQALPFYQQGGYRAQTLQALTLIGQALRLRGEYDEAMRTFEQQLQLAQGWNNRMNIAMAQQGIATILFYRERYSEALVKIEESYSIYNDLKAPLYAGYSLISKADALWRLGLYDDAEAALSQAKSLAEHPDGRYKQLWGRYYVVSAPMAFSQGQFSEAIKNSEQAISLDDSHTKHAAITAKYTLGLAQYLSGMKDAGTRTCEEAVDMAEKASDPYLLSSALLTLAEVKLLSGEPQVALEFAKKAQERYERFAQAESQWRAWLIIGRANYQLGDMQAARQALLRADALLTSLRQTWGEQYFDNYLQRRDIRLYREQLKKYSVYSQ